MLLRDAEAYADADKLVSKYIPVIITNVTETQRNTMNV